MSSNNAIFVRSSKCAGASIKSALRSHSASNYTFTKHFYSRYRLQSGTDERTLYTILHGQVRYVARHLSEIFESSWKFAIVRNPWDRAVSAYHYCRRYNEIPDSVSFKDYLETDFTVMTPFVFAVAQPQCDILDGPGGCDYLDFVGRFERLQKDFDHICENLGLPKTVLPHRHKTRHNPYWEYYDSALVALVKRKYAQDVERFEYEFAR